MNTTAKFFQDKTQYKAFRLAFANGQKDKRTNKSYTFATGKRWNDKTKASEEYQYRVKHDGWLCSTHYLLFNLVCGKDYYNGFTPKTKALFVQSGGDPDRGLNGAIDHLSSLNNQARMLLGLNVAEQPPSWIKDKKQWVADRMNSYQTAVNAFLEPMGGVFTLQDLARIQLPSFPGCPANREEVAGKKLTYKELFGSDVVDQTPDEEDEPVVVATAADFGMKEEPKKKGILARMFGG